MQIQKIKLAQLAPNTGQIPGLPSNPRQWTKSDVDRIAKSLAETPELFEARPIIAYPFDGKFVILGGNLRYEGARKNKDTEVPVIVLPEDTPADKLKEIVIKDNGNFGAWDFDALANEWDNGRLLDWGVPAWEEPGEEKPLGSEASEDEFDEDTDEVPTRCKTGDIWELGAHRLMCGDSTDAAQVALLMGGEKADLLLTDPPYNVGYGYEGSLLMGQRKHRTDGKVVMNDKQEDGEFLSFLIRSFTVSSENMKPGASFYIFHADNEGYNFRKALRSVDGLTLRECLVWVKDALCLGRQDYQWRHEPCLYGWKEGASHSWYSDRKQTTVLEFARPKRSEEHPTMKPIPLFSYLLKNSSKPGDIVLDLFAGSGTTLICSEQLGRRCFTMELDPHYCDVILARWEKLTGQTATKL